MDELDEFLTDTAPIAPEELGTTLVPQSQMTKKEFNESLMRVYTQLGGDKWLLEQAESYPKEFLNMLKPLIEKSDSASVTGIHITVDGESVRVEGRSYKELGVLNGSGH